MSEAGQGKRCPRKTGYRDHLAARIAAAGITKYDARPYRCPHCGRWHLTSQPKRADA